MYKKILVVCTTDSMIWNFLIPHIKKWESEGFVVECVASRTGFYFDELRDKYNINLNEIPFSRSPFKYINFKCLKSLNSLAKEKKYDLIICQEPVGGVMGRLTGKINKTKVIYTAHGFHFYSGAPITNWLLFYPVERLLAHFTDSLITSNEEDYKRAEKFKSKKVFKINGVGVDLKKFASDRDKGILVKNELGLPFNSKVIINAAEMIERKNHTSAIQAFAKANIENSVFVICGVGEQEYKLKELVKELKIEDKVYFLGFRKDLENLYNMADVLLFPSYQEGLSVTLLSAMASGLPVVCSNIRGNIDVIDNSKGGYLFKPNDIDGMAKGLVEILNKKEEFGDYNRKKAKKFAVREVVNYMYSIILNTIGFEDKV